MIPKIQILEHAKEQQLQATTIEKDYILGWLLYGIGSHPRLSRWVFKGGTCLKKCFFETYRFSEDLDFTVAQGTPYDDSSIRVGLQEVAAWIEDRTGVQFDHNGIDIDRYANKRGKTTFQAKMTYAGPLALARRQLQRVKFDLTQDEIVANNPDRRPVFHPYTDAMDPQPTVLCYGVDEILAEKTRALYERQGRARDVYDVVHISRNFRESIEPERARRIALDKFAYKELPNPAVSVIVARVDPDVLRANWNDQLGHQLPVLPPVDTFLSELSDSIAWWLEPGVASKPPARIAAKPGERILPRAQFPSFAAQVLSMVSGPSGLGGRSRVGIDALRYAARNRLMARVVYHGLVRTVEPYSLRQKATGNTLLYVYEIEKDGRPSGRVKAFKVDEIQFATVIDRPFAPRYFVEM